ncbi:hypothetical protein BJ944DRAFT_289013 [Cunninghamella echinulata]|nr:hypothetical protein BJ944DRAFT_289013 [Cunninghamella echinulata]
MTEMTCTSTQYTQETLVNSCTSAPLYELQEVIQQFKSHPELLKLILTSKVEEDKRRTEEAKLKSKELDYYLKHDTPPPTSLTTTTSNNNNNDTTTNNSNNNNNNNNNSSNNSNNISSSSRLSISSLSSNTSSSSLSPTTLKPISSISASTPSLSATLPPISTTTPSSPPNNHRKMSISSKSPSDRFTPYPPQQRKNSFDERRHSAAAAMLAMGSSSFIPSSPKSTTSSCESSHSSDETFDSPTLSASNAYPSPKAEQYEENEDSDPPKPRRRREMQAITKIVETREFPYMDNYFWRNNGNTTQKKTGCRSIYYKCSNSNKNCMVNKTITERPDGVYLIKYRGTHLPICVKSKVYLYVSILSFRGSEKVLVVLTLKNFSDTEWQGINRNQ